MPESQSKPLGDLSLFLAYIYVKLNYSNDRTIVDTIGNKIETFRADQKNNWKTLMRNKNRAHLQIFSHENLPVRY